MQNQVTNDKESRHFFQWNNVAQKVSIYYREELLASSTQAILLKEVGREIYDGAYYLPMEDVNQTYLKHSQNQTHCPIKGEAAYFSFQKEDTLVEDIAWYYPDPIKKSQVIKNYVSFYSNKVKFVIEPV